MNHHTAAPKADGTGFHYVSLNKRHGGYPLGYCAEHAPHATEDEARACYRAWQRDHVRLDAVTLGNWTNCRFPGCEQPTRAAADIQGDGYNIAPLCPAHLTTEHAIPALGLADALAGDSRET